MKLYKDGQLVGEFSTTELKELAGVDIEKAADVAAEIEAVEDKVFKVGDKVKVVGVSVTGRDEFIGNTAVIKYITLEGDIQIVEGDGFNGWYRPSSLKLIEKQTQPITEELSQTVESNAITLAEAAKPKFEIGDAISVNGRFALILSELDSEHEYKIKWYSDGGQTYAGKSYIRHATEEEKSHLQTLIGREQDEYKVGDLARLETSGLRNSLRTHVGCIFEVGHINSTGAIHLSLGDNRNDTMAYTNPKYIKLITPVEWRHDFVEEVK